MNDELSKSDFGATESQAKEERFETASRREDERAAASSELSETTLDLSLFQSARQILHAIDHHSRTVVEQHGITSPQLMCLSAIVNDGLTGATAISRRVRLSTSTIAGIMLRLEKKGLVERERDTEDRRSVIVRATDEGVRIARQVTQPLEQALNHAVRQLSEEEREDVVAALRRIADIAEDARTGNE